LAGVHKRAYASIGRHAHLLPGRHQLFTLEFLPGFGRLFRVLLGLLVGGQPQAFVVPVFPVEPAVPGR
jgi:hypothetical protein